jgi:hypothetical protein
MPANEHVPISLDEVISEIATILAGVTCAIETDAESPQIPAVGQSIRLSQNLSLTNGCLYVVVSALKEEVGDEPPDSRDLRPVVSVSPLA